MTSPLIGLVSNFLLGLAGGHMANVLKGGDISCGLSKVGLSMMPSLEPLATRQQNAPSHVQGHCCHGFGTMPSPEELMATKGNS